MPTRLVLTAAALSLFALAAGAAPVQDDEPPFTAREVTRKVIILSKPEPGVTDAARRNNTYGLVRLRAVLTKDGRVMDIRVVKGLPDGLTEKAIAAARKLKFRPAEKDGRPVSQWVTLEYNFNLPAERATAILVAPIIVPHANSRGVRIAREAVTLEQPAAEYTEEARQRGVEGKVVLEVWLEAEGAVTLHRVVEGLPHGLTEKAQEAAKKIKFTPAVADGREAATLRRVEYVFALDR